MIRKIYVHKNRFWCSPWGSAEFHLLIDTCSFELCIQMWRLRYALELEFIHG